jgi:hypothetical protein
VTGKVQNVNFLRYAPGTRLKIPVSFINGDLSDAAKRGCFMVRVNNYVECVCDGDVPEKLVIDLANSRKGDVYRVNSITMPPQVRPYKTVPPDLVLLVVKSPSKD